MAKLEHMHRVVHRHDWINLDEWASAIADLADLSDEELEVIGSPDNGFSRAA